MWFTANQVQFLGRISPDGGIDRCPLPTLDAGLNWIARGPDGVLWVSESGANRIARIDVPQSAAKTP
jgi:virginiamycin B lyase